MDYGSDWFWGPCYLSLKYVHFVLSVGRQNDHVLEEVGGAEGKWNWEGGGSYFGTQCVVNCSLSNTMSIVLVCQSAPRVRFVLFRQDEGHIPLWNYKKTNNWQWEHVVSRISERNNNGIRVTPFPNRQGPHPFVKSQNWQHLTMGTCVFQNLGQG